MNHSPEKDELERHEVRGIFVLGVIGTLLGLWQLPNTVFVRVPRITLHLIIFALTVYWGLFVFFMALAVSDDWVWKRIVDASYSIAKFLFRAGIGFLLAIFVMIIVQRTLGAYAAFLAFTITALVLGFLFKLKEPTRETSKTGSKEKDEVKK
jgi:hypothetical protein